MMNNFIIVLLIILGFTLIGVSIDLDIKYQVWDGGLGWFGFSLLVVAGLRVWAIRRMKDKK